MATKQLLIGTVFGVTPLPVLPVTDSLRLHLDAADTSTIDVNGSDEVTEWRDKSAAGITGDFTPFDSNRPLSNTDTVNGWNVVTFQDDATDRALVSALAGDIKNGSNGYSYYVVFEADDVNGEEVILFKGGDSPSEDLGNEFAAYTGTGGISHRVATGDGTPIFGFALGPQLSTNDLVGYLSYVADPIGPSPPQAQVDSYVNGSLDSSRFDWDSINDPMTVSARPYYVGARNNQAQSAISDVFKGRICEIIVYGKPLSSGERASVDAYLDDKWGVV